MLLSSVFTANLLFIGLVRGLIIALIAMGIVLVYRSSRVINFAVGDLGVPSAALMAVMVTKHHWPYWPALLAALAIGTLAGTVIELAVIRRLFHAPRVIVLVATIGVAELAQAVDARVPGLPDRQLDQGLPEPDPRRVAPGRRHHGQRRPTPRPRRCPADHAGHVVAARPHPVRRGGPGVGRQP